MEASKATAHHIKQVASDPQVAQINLMRHQCTDFPPSKHKKKQSFKPRPPSHKQYTSQHQQVPPYKKKFDPKQAHKSRDRCSKCGDSKHVEGFKCPTKKFQCKMCNKYGHVTSLCYRKQASFKSRTFKAHQLQAEQVYVQEDSICGQSEDLTSSSESFCLQVRIHCAQTSSKTLTTSHHITNLAYKLKPHHKSNQYLRTRLDTCANVNVMPASVYKLVFHDLELRKLAPSKLEIGTYTTHTVKLVASCVFNLVHSGPKCLQEVPFFVAVIMEVFCCHVVPNLHLVYSCTLDWAIFSPRASLITDSADHPNKTKSQVNVHVS